jgi:hypothetical protein
MFTRAILASSIFAALLLFSEPVSAQTFMSEDELLATIPGSVIDGKSKNGTVWAQAYSVAKGGKKSGTINVNFGGEKSKSKWAVKDRMWCEDWGSGSACWQVERVGDKGLRMYENGKPKPNLWVMR